MFEFFQLVKLNITLFRFTVRFIVNNMWFELLFVIAGVKTTITRPIMWWWWWWWWWRRW